MGKVDFAIVRYKRVTVGDATQILIDADHVGNSEVLTSGASSTPTTIAAPAAPSQSDNNDIENYVWRVTNHGTEGVHVTRGATPVASATVGIGLANGESVLIPCKAYGEKCAVITV